MIIGWSLEKWNLSSGKQKIAVNISPTIYPEEDIFLTVTGQVNINYNIDESVLASLGYDGAKNEIEAASYSLNNSLQQPVTRLAQFAQISAAKITAGLITAKNIIADNIIAKNIFTKQIKSDVILTGDLTSTQATFDVATVSGTLTAQKISATEATFDVVYADRIISPEGNFSQVLTDKITSLRDEIRQIIAQRQAESTPSAIYTASSTWDTSEATLSAQTAPLSAGDLTLDGNLILGADLTLKGLASLNSVSVSSLLAVGQIALQDNILETTASTLFIQPSGAGTISLLKDRLIITDTGDVTVNGNLKVTGNLIANMLTAQKLEVEEATIKNNLNVGKINIATALPIIANAVIASDSAAISTLSSNATAGVASLPAGSTEVVINNNRLTSSSMVYLTPNGSTQNQVIYVKNKSVGDSLPFFTIGLDSTLPTDLSVNWWIIN